MKPALAQEIFVHSVWWLLGQQRRDAWDAAACAHDPRRAVARRKRDEARRQRFALDLKAPIRKCRG